MSEAAASCRNAGISKEFAGVILRLARPRYIGLRLGTLLLAIDVTVATQGPSDVPSVDGVARP